MIYTSEAYQGTPDLEDMLALVRARPAVLALRFPSPADLRELMNVPAHRDLTRLWRAADGRLAGFALLIGGVTYASFALESRPEELAGGLGSAMIGWGEEVFQSSYRGQATGLSASAEENDPHKIALLERHGFTRQNADALRMERPLDEPISPPKLPV
jgi:hypothetical protein